MNKATLILHDVRKTLNISANEYILLDLIYTLSRNTGWCFARREVLADNVGITKRGVQAMISRLMEIGLIEKAENLMIRTSKKWEDTYLLDPEKDYGNGLKTVNKKQTKSSAEPSESSKNRGEKSSPPHEKSSSQGVKKVHLRGEKSSSIYKNLTKNSYLRNYNIFFPQFAENENLLLSEKLEELLLRNNLQIEDSEKTSILAGAVLAGGSSFENVFAQVEVIFNSRHPQVTLPAPAESKQPTLRQKFIDRWFSFHKAEWHFEPNFTAIDGNKINLIIKFLTEFVVKQKQDPTEETLLGVWDQVLLATRKDKYLRDKATLPLINSNINVLIRLCLPQKSIHDIVAEEDRLMDEAAYGIPNQSQLS